MRSIVARLRPVPGLVFVAWILASGPALAGRPYVDIEKKLPADQMHATGLDQLDPQQLSLLNQLLRDEQESIDSENATGQDHGKREAEAPISSRLKGEFKGWTNGTVFELENGQRWRVLDGEFYTAKRLPSPGVTVKPGLFGSWYMQIEGANVNIKVKRIDN